MNMKTQITTWILRELITKARLPELPDGLQFVDRKKAEMTGGNFIVASVDAHGIMNVHRAMEKVGFPVTVKQIGDFYRYWRKEVLGFNTCTKGIFVDREA